MDYFTRYFDSTNISCITFELYYDHMKSYEEINVILPEEMRENG